MTGRGPEMGRSLVCARDWKMSVAAVQRLREGESSMKHDVKTVPLLLLSCSPFSTGSQEELHSAWIRWHLIPL